MTGTVLGFKKVGPNTAHDQSMGLTIRRVDRFRVEASHGDAVVSFALTPLMPPGSVSVLMADWSEAGVSPLGIDWALLERSVAMGLAASGHVVETVRPDGTATTW